MCSNGAGKKREDYFSGFSPATYVLDFVNK